MAMKHPLGQYNRAMALMQRNSTTPNAYKEDVLGTPTQLTKRWARIEPLSGREFFIAMQAQSQTSHRINMRFYSGLTSRRHYLTVTTGGVTRTFEIESVIDLNDAHEEHELMCVEKT